MTIDEFEKEISQKLHEFITNWKIKAVEEPEVWPLDMGVADWYESFNMSTED